MPADRSTLAAPALLVPITVEAAVVTEASSRGLWSWQAPVYQQLPRFESSDAQPFTRVRPQKDNRAFTGVVVHWALPDGITQGAQTGPGDRIAYPAAPNRWLVVRKFRDPQAPNRWAFSSIVVASDYVGDRSGSPYPDPRGTGPSALGKAWPLAQWPGEAAVRPHALHPPLTAVGPDDATYAAFAPNVQNVVSIADPLTEVSEGPLSYAVYGWYADPTTDPLANWQTRDDWRHLMARLRWSVGDDCADLHDAMEAARRWATDHGLVVDPAQPRSCYPERTLCHGTTAEVAWFGPTGPWFSGVPVSFSGAAGFIRPKIAIGNSAADALAALLGAALADRIAPHRPEQVVDVVHAFQKDLLPLLAAPDGQAQADLAAQATWFTATHGGTTWQVAAPPDPDDPAGRETPAELTPAQATLLTALNTYQRALDERQPSLSALQTQVDALWWRVRYLDWHTDLQRWRPQVELATERIQRDTRTAIGSFRWLRQQRDACLIALTDALGPSDGGGPVLRSKPAPSYSLPNEPVVLISGAGRGFKHGNDGDSTDSGRLACRFTGQTITGIELFHDGRTLDVDGDQVPVPELTGRDLPAELGDLSVEAAFLDLTNAPVIAAAADPHEPWPLLEPIRRAQSAVWNAALHPVFDPAVVADLAGLRTRYGLGALPSKVGVQLWSPPWSPLYLDWKVRYSPAVDTVDAHLRDWASPADSDQTGPDDWTYRWTGARPTEAVSLKGRALLTPQQPDVLAAQLERVLDQPAVDGPALRDAIGYLRRSDLLCQALSGFDGALLQRSPLSFPAPADPALEPYLRPAGAPWLVPSARPAPDSVAEQFTPLRAGHLALENLWVVDDFGQAFAVFDAIGRAPSDYAPILGPDLVTPGFAELALLKPRLAQYARLELPLLDADRDDRELGVATDANPVCGWLLANPTEGGVLVFSAGGAMLGQVGLADSGARWWPAPETAAAGDEPDPARIGNRHLRGLVSGVLDRDDSGHALRELLALLDDGASATDPEGPWVDEELPVPVGRPVAVIRGLVRYRLHGPPVTSELWSDVGHDVTNGFEEVQLPVQLGSTELLDDAVVGAYLDDDYRQIQSVYADPSAGDGYVGTRRADPAIRDASGVLLTMVVAPHATIHAITGVLPALEVDVPAWSTTPALRRIALALRAGPVLGHGAGAVLPLAPAVDGAWSWLAYLDTVKPAGEYPVDPADATAHLPDAPPVVSEGWLKLLPGGRPTAFRYAVAPRAVACTVDPQLPSTATVRVTVYNGTSADVVCSELRLRLPVGDGDGFLTAYPETIAARSEQPEWSIEVDDRGTLVATPTTGRPVPAGAVLTFLVTGVQVSPVPGVAVVDVQETTDQTRTTMLAVHKVGR